MKIVKSENNLTNNIVIPEKNEKEEKQKEEVITIEKEKTIESLMNELLPKVKNDENHVTFEITLTKRQKESYDAKGGLSWLKKCIDRNVSVKKTNKRKK